VVLAGARDEVVVAVPTDSWDAAAWVVRAACGVAVVVMAACRGMVRVQLHLWLYAGGDGSTGEGDGGDDVAGPRMSLWTVRQIQ